MNVVDVTFKLLHENAPFPASEIEKVEKEAKSWERKLIEKDDVEKNPVERIYARLRHNWVFSLCIGFLYIIMSKRISAYKADNQYSDAARLLRRLDEERAEQDEDRGFWS